MTQPSPKSSNGWENTVDNINPALDPVAAYHAINEKVFRSGDGIYPTVEIVQDLAQMLLACRTLIQHNSILSTAILDAEKKTTDILVESFEKDIKIHELTEKLAQKGPDEGLPRN